MNGFFCDLIRILIIHLLGFLSLVSPRIFCVFIIPMLHYVITISCAHILVTSSFHLDYNTRILYERMHFNLYNKLYFNLPYSNILTCKLIYLYYMVLFRKGMCMKSTFKYLFKRLLWCLHVPVHTAKGN